MKQKSVVVFSGGADSTTVLAMALKKADNDPSRIVALTFTYGQKHSIELESAKIVAEHYGVELVTADLSQAFQFDKSCTLLKGNGSIEHDVRYEDQSELKDYKPIDTYVPFRNGIMLAYAAAVALSVGADVLYYGSHLDDSNNGAYPDSSPAFDKAMDEAIQLGTGGQVRVIGLLVDMTKEQVIQEGLRLGVPYEKTWTCYEPTYIGQDGISDVYSSCGTCPSCRKRIESFVNNGVKDPIHYADDKYNVIEVAK